MKTSKSPEATEVTPSKKILKQARLPFKIITEDSPKTAVLPSRKRKLSTPNAEPVTKVGKICKENGTIKSPVIVIDDDSRDEKSSESLDKLPNPYVNLVGTALKKKEKHKSKKRKSSRNTVVKKNGSVDTADDKTDDDCEMMEVDEHVLINDRDTKTTITNKEIIEKEADIVNLSEQDNIVEDVSQTEDKNDKSHKSVSKEEISVTKTAIQVKESSNSQDTPNKLLQSPDKNEKNVSVTEELKTPRKSKRNMQNKTKQEENNNSKKSPSNSLNKESSSDHSTPDQSRSSSITKLDESLNESLSSSKLTPKQLQKKLESAKKREEREKERQERELKRQQEKEERTKQKQEKEDQRKREREEKEEVKKKEREEKEEQKKKEKEEKEKLKELEKKQKEEKEELKRKEKEEKEEQKRKEREAREDEKRKKQEALELEKQEQELKKKKTAEAFVSFFVPKQKVEKDQPIVGTVSNNMLTNFTLKSDMRLAPTTRTSLSQEKAQELVKLIEEQNVMEDGLYLRSLKSGACKPMASEKTWPHSDKDDDDVILVEDELPTIDGAGEIITCVPTTQEKLRPKLLSFHENRRPPYWGTWRKKSSFVKPRKPFAQDEKQLDYEVDSDEEWEEEQEGESLDGSAAGSDDEQGPDEYEVDNEVFVPHGYLSDEEATMDEDDVLSLSPETQKARLKHLEDEFESEMKKPTEKLKPRLYGLLWENSEGGKPEKCVDAMWQYFGKLSMIIDDPTPFLQPSQDSEETERKKVKKKKVANGTDGEQSPKIEKKKKIKTQEKESKSSTPELKKNGPEIKKNQPGINMFLTKIKST